MRKFVLMAVAMALVTALPSRGPGQDQDQDQEISTGIYLDVAGLIDRHGGVTYYWYGGSRCEALRLSRWSECDVLPCRAQRNRHPGRLQYDAQFFR